MTFSFNVCFFSFWSIVVPKTISELLSPTLFDIFLERFTRETLEGRKGVVSFEGWIITNFADDSVVNAEEEEEAGGSVTDIDTSYNMVTHTSSVQWNTEYSVVIFVVILIAFAEFICL